jgi:outer membrane receptor for ferrienterochelin and colicins
MRLQWLWAVALALALLPVGRAAGPSQPALPFSLTLGLAYAQQEQTAGSDSDDAVEIDLGDEGGEKISIDDEGDSADVAGDEAGSEEIDLGEAQVEGQAVEVTAAAPETVQQTITAAEIEQSGAASISDLLQQEAGFTVTDSFAGSEVSFQGLPSKFTVVLVDGQRLPGHIFERVDLSQLPVANLERVEIIRGPQAAAYGSDSAGVVVNLITKKGGAGGGSLDLGVGTFGYNRQRLAYGGSSGQQNWFLATERLQRDAYDLNSTYPDTDGDGFRQFDFLGKYDVALGKDRFSLQLESFREDARGQGYSPPDQIRSNETLTRRFQGTVSYDWALGGNRSLTVAHNYGTYYHDLYRYWIGYEDSTAIRSGFKDTIQDSSLHYTQYGKQYLLTAGAELSHDELQSDRISVEGTVSADLASGFVTYEYLPPGDWSASAALRYDDHDYFGSELSPKASVTYKPGATSSLALSAGQGYRSPSLRERYYEFASPFGYSVIGNPNLQPERVWSFNFDYERNAADRSLRLGLFRHEIKDLIVFDMIQDSPQVFQTTNIGDGHSSGLELAAHQSWLIDGCAECGERRFAAGYDATWIFDAADEELGTELVNSPELSQRVRFTATQPGASAELLVNNTSARYVDRENLSQAPEFTTVDLTLTRDIGHGTLKLAGLNLFDVSNGKYGPEPGREVRLEYSLNF